MSDFPENLWYSTEHEWLTPGEDPATVGITKHAADALGDIVYVQLPEVGDRVEAGQPCGELESTKSVSDLYAPATGEVVEVNRAVLDNPGLINSDPYGAGWLFRVKLESEPEGLLSAEQYAAHVD
ncbi:glycine cleavage system protein H [Carbonactinospora thermoautotrophica]|uniref:Glycine cleavage system H protein n=1 Tax=Carbonactinospora thermoautotrophica TaxID=1469144 RepID=A0A132MS81_9ACTN|nr:glycine cleavage system protein GcvH [Carbonactinospora thermoautotrophica]KWW97249.1 Glycine cleavage system H protein [Carbonactinospora thermoautotrophica]KWX00606.1 glycine cleavage system protein H [Carbonactinospora thermoautotrophica]KWX10266.1 glycine cleavage system protein H [Carbonactinospora thermoautotrophica]MCX9193843.1 glycine cleavage system protein H [Carbonactinospora thermoautotrophica]